MVTETKVSPAMTRPTHWGSPTPPSAARASATTRATGPAQITQSSQRCRVSGAHGRGNSTENATSPAQPTTYRTWVLKTYSHRARSPRTSTADTPISSVRSLPTTPPPSPPPAGRPPRPPPPSRPRSAGRLGAVPGGGQPYRDEGRAGGQDEGHQ